MNRRDRFEPSSGPGIGISIGLTIAALSALSIAFVPAHGEVADAPSLVHSPNAPAGDLPLSAKSEARAH